MLFQLEFPTFPREATNWLKKEAGGVEDMPRSARNPTIIPGYKEQEILKIEMLNSFNNLVKIDSFFLNYQGPVEHLRMDGPDIFSEDTYKN